MPAASLDPTDADAAELLRLARGDAPEDRPYGVANRVRLESAGLIRRNTRMRADGFEAPDGWALTAAGWARVREIAGGACTFDPNARERGPAEVAWGGDCISSPAPSHDNHHRRRMT